MEKKCLGRKYFGSKKVLGEKIFGKNNLVKKFGSKIFMSKKQVGLAQGGGYMTPRPPENSRVKIVLDCS